MTSLVHERGIYSPFRFWHGGLAMMRHGVWIDQVLAAGTRSSEHRARVKAAGSLFAYVLWDDDFVPLGNDKGIGLGTPNMALQQKGYRDFYALLLANHPHFSERARDVSRGVMSRVPRQINEHGAHMGAPHYIAASFNRHSTR